MSTLRFVPLRVFDEEMGALLDSSYRRISPLEEPKSLKGFLARPKLIHWGVGEDPEEIISLLGRTGIEKPNLPIVVLSRQSMFEPWDQELSIPAHMERNHEAFVGFYPVRLQYRLWIMAFEQPVLDTLCLVTYAQLRSEYRRHMPLKLQAPSGHYDMDIHATILDTNSIQFNNELITDDQTRLFASSCEFSIGTFTYHLPSEEEIITVPVRFEFDEIFFIE